MRCRKWPKDGAAIMALLVLLYLVRMMARAPKKTVALVCSMIIFVPSIVLALIRVPLLFPVAVAKESVQHCNALVFRRVENVTQIYAACVDLTFVQVLPMNAIDLVAIQPYNWATINI